VVGAAGFENVVKNMSAYEFAASSVSAIFGVKQDKAAA
jgi:hypothetical protein